MKRSWLVTVSLLAAICGPVGAQDSSDVRTVGLWPYGPYYAVAYANIGGTNYAVIGSGGGVMILNVNTPGSPTKVGEIATPGIARGVAVSGNYAYVADQLCGLRIINISDPAHPTEAGYYDTPGCAYGLAVSGNYAYVTDYTAGLRIINISDPANPTEAGYCYTPGYASGVTVSGNYAYVADENTGLRIINISDPAHPTEVGYYDTPGSAYGVAITGGYAYVADRDAGLRIYQYYGPGGVAADPTTSLGDLSLKLEVRGDRIVYQLPRDGVTSLKVYNLLGQEVRTLISGVCAPGSYAARWDGKDRSGRRVSSGVYLVRLWCGGQSVVGKLLVVK